ncbi:hypothetical protein JOM56_015091 [Amanita muscaria]
MSSFLLPNNISNSLLNTNTHKAPPHPCPASASSHPVVNRYHLLTFHHGKNVPKRCLKLQDPMLTVPRPAKAKALQNKIWQDQSSVRRKRVDSTSDVQPRTKEPRVQEPSASQAKAYHRYRPAVLSDNEDAEGLIAQVLTRAPKKKPVHPPPDYEGESNKESDEEDAYEDEVLDEYNLHGLDKEIIESEAPQWAPQKTIKVRKAATSQSSAGQDDVQLPPVHDEYEATTASENDHFQGEREGLPTDDDSEKDKDSEDDSSGGPKQLPHWASVYKKYQGGSREQAAVAMGFVSSTSEGVNKDRTTQSKQWRAAPYDLPSPGQRLISLKTQPLTLREILGIAIRQVTGDAMCVSAYTPIEKLPGYLLSVVLGSVPKVEGGEVYVARLNRDVMLKVDLVRLLNNRLSIYQSKTKRIARGIVEVKYSLDSEKADRKSQIVELVKNSQFIFARKEISRDVDRSKPFQHPVILRVLQEVYFSGRRGQSLGSKHSSRFTSSIKEGAASNELELPPAMVAMAATAVHAALEDFVMKQDFSADLYEDKYLSQACNLSRPDPHQEKPNLVIYLYSR